jgi:SAM-dependent methyltransferase
VELGWLASTSPRPSLSTRRKPSRRVPLGIRYVIGNGQELPFAPDRFDFATAFMSLMDMPRPDAALRETWRVLRSGGFLQFSITHPCFFPPHRRQLRNERGEPYAVELGRYFARSDGEIDRWTFSAAPPETRGAYRPFEIPRFHRTLSDWLNAVVDAGFTVERIAEPHADDETARRVPRICGHAHPCVLPPRAVPEGWFAGAWRRRSSKRLVGGYFAQP